MGENRHEPLSVAYQRGEKLGIKSGRSKFTLATLPAADFPSSGNHPAGGREAALPPGEGLGHRAGSP